MKSSECKLNAREKLSGKWGKAACISLVYTIIFFVIGFVEGLFPESIQPILSLIVAIIEVPLGFGLIFSFFKLYNGDEVNVFDFLTLGFSNFAKSWKISLRIFLKMIVPVILIIISYILIAVGISMTMASLMLYNSSSTTGFSAITIIGFILLIVSMIWAITKSYYYQLAYIIAVDNSDLDSKEAIEKSQELMNGNRRSLFVLQLSFIGWAILAVFTFGIGYLWLVPYIQCAIIAFYKGLTGNSSNIKAEVITENDNPIQEN